MGTLRVPAPSGPAAAIGATCGLVEIEGGVQP